MTIPQDVIDKGYGALDQYAILVAYRGSIAHGMYVPKTDPNSIDDKDIMGVCVPPKEFYFGYDTKNAAHLIRLLRMGIEFLTDGELHVLRSDASQLLEIKKGFWTLEQVKDESSRLFGLAEQAYINSKLPNKPNPSKINNLSMAIIESGLGLS